MKRPRNIILALAVAVCVFSVWWGTGGIERVRNSDLFSSRSGSRTETGSGSGTLPANGLDLDTVQPVHLVVLNGTGRSGLANEVSLGVALHGCVVEGIGNAPHDRFEQCLLINRRLADAVARDLAERLGGLPVLKETDSRTTEDAVLVLGSDYQQLLQRLTRVQRPD